MTQLIIIRGLPGSGKSTLAKKFSDIGFVHFESDMYFAYNGKYLFDPAKLSEAHNWCFNNVNDALMRGRNVVVSNTFSRIWEMQRYLDLPFPKTVLTCEGNFGNIHDVPQYAIDRMKQRWERYE